MSFVSLNSRVTWCSPQPWKTWLFPCGPMIEGVLSTQQERRKLNTFPIKSRNYALIFFISPQPSVGLGMRQCISKGLLNWRRPGSTVIQCKLNDSWQWPLGTEDKEKQIRGTGWRYECVHKKRKWVLGNLCEQEIREWPLSIPKTISREVWPEYVDMTLLPEPQNRWGKGLLVWLGRRM